MSRISEEWIQELKIRKAHYGEDVTREEAIEELERLVQFAELLIEVGERAGWKMPNQHN